MGGTKRSRKSPSKKGVGTAACKCGKKWKSDELGWKYIKDLGLLCPKCAEKGGFDSKKPGLVMKVVDECQTNSPNIAHIATLGTGRQTKEYVDPANAQPQPDSSERGGEPRQMSLIQLLNSD